MNNKQNELEFSITQLYQSIIDFAISCKISNKDDFEGSDLTEITAFEKSRKVAIPFSIKTHLLFFGKKMGFESNNTSYGLKLNFNIIDDAIAITERWEMNKEIRNLLGSDEGILPIKYEEHRGNLHFVIVNDNKDPKRIIYDAEELLEGHTFPAICRGVLSDLCFTKAWFENLDVKEINSNTVDIERFKRLQKMDVSEFDWFPRLVSICKNSNIYFKRNFYLRSFDSMLEREEVRNGYYLDFEEFMLRSIIFLEYTI